MKRLVLTAIAVAVVGVGLTVSASAHAMTMYTAVRSGDWMDPDTWGGAIPNVYEPDHTVNIPRDIEVYLEGTDAVVIEDGQMVINGRLVIHGSLLVETGAEGSIMSIDIGATGELTIESNGYLWLEAKKLDDQITVDNKGWLVNNGVFEQSWTTYVWSGGNYLNNGTHRFLTPEAQLFVEGVAFNFGSMSVGHAVASGIQNNGVFHNGGSIHGLRAGTSNTGRFVNDGFVGTQFQNRGLFENYGKFVGSEFTNIVFGGATGEIEAINHDGAEFDTRILEVHEGWLINEAGGVLHADLLSVFEEGAMENDSWLVVQDRVVNQGLIADRCSAAWYWEQNPTEDPPWEGNQREDWCDDTPPEIRHGVVGVLGSNDWYVSDVQVYWVVSEPETRILEQSGCHDRYLTFNTSGYEVQCTATSPGGTTLETVTVRIDTTSPTATAVPDRNPNAHGWYDSVVTVSISGVDWHSGIASCEGPFILSEGLVRSAKGTCSDNAGNISNLATANGINIDLTPPIVSWEASSDPNANGWYNSDVTVTYSGIDALSGIDFCDEPFIFDTDGAGLEVSGACSDRAGHSTEVKATIDLDKTAPTVGARLSTPANSNGWHNTDVNVLFDGEDATSGIASCDTMEFNGVEAANLAAEGTCVDVAGNVGPPMLVDNINIDLTDPTLEFARSTENYLLSDSVDVRCIANDALSGIELSQCSEAVGYGYEFDHAAPNWVSGSAWDYAGNTATADHSFTILVTRAGIDFVIDQYVADEKLVRDLKGELDKITKSDSKKKDKGKSDKTLGGFEEAALVGVSPDDLTDQEAQHLIDLVEFLYGPSTTSVADIS
ncbi:MAG: hypothetical protein ACR2N7_06220 [Acidimicrobiia bacterium]